ncbi:MAG: hypothetical protein LW808_003015 [Verrucomicrobiota bacterium]|nr:MAG: hypothetical protein LW808_003015 [Verrucomicrobiota bacterium]
MSGATTYFYVTEASRLTAPGRCLPLRYPIAALFLLNTTTAAGVEVQQQFPDVKIVPLEAPSIKTVSQAILKEGESYDADISVFLDQAIYSIDVQALFKRLCGASIRTYFVASHLQSLSEFTNFTKLDPEEHEINLFDEIKEFDGSR